MADEDIDEISFSKGTVIEIDMREIAVLICEGVLGVTRPAGFTVDQAYDHIGDLNPKAHDDFRRAAIKVLNYVEDCLRKAAASSRRK